MPGLVPGIHVLLSYVGEKDVDGRVKPGHDGKRYSAAN
jgi:zinc D-Ala-D-Ala dipeptidase